MKKLLLLFTTVLLGATVAFATVIDNFNVSTPGIDVYNPDNTSGCGAGGTSTNPSSTTPGSTIIGGSGTRVLSATANASSCVTGAIDSGLYPGVLAGGTIPSSGSGAWKVVGAADNPASLSGKAVYLDFKQDTGVTTVTLTLTDGSNTAVFSRTFSGGGTWIQASLPGMWGALNANAVTGYTLDITGGLGTDFEIDNIITSVPEPGTMILMGAGLLGFALYRRRR